MKVDVEKLRLARSARGMSQEDVAAAAGISPRTMQRIESGQAASFETARALVALFETFEVDVRMHTDARQGARTDEMPEHLPLGKARWFAQRWSSGGIALGGVCSLVGIMAGFFSGGMNWSELALALCLLGLAVGVSFEILAYLNQLPYRRGTNSDEPT